MWVLVQPAGSMDNSAPSDSVHHNKNQERIMEDSLKPPYLKKVGQRGNIILWIVDGTYVRAHLDEEFTNFGHHYSFTCIPENEFWLDKEAKEDEQKFFIDHMLDGQRVEL
jgi:hypothetical protein